MGLLLIALMDELRLRGYAVHVGGAGCLEVSGSAAQIQTLRCGNLRDRGKFDWPKPVGRRPTIRQAIGDLPVVDADSRNEALPV